MSAVRGGNLLLFASFSNLVNDTVIIYFQNNPGFNQGNPERRKKCALLISYCGAGYYGIQIQL